MNKELIQKDKEDKAIKFYTNYIENQEKELDWMYRQDEEYYRDEIEQKELLIKGFKTILNLIEKQSKEIEHWKAGMKIIEKDKNNHIERLEREIKELDSQNEVLEEIKTSYEKKTDKLLKEKVKKEKEIEDVYKMLTAEKEKNINLIDTNKKLYEMGKQNAIQELINNDYTSNDKIKAKIKELDKEEKEELKGTKGQDRYAIKQEYMHKRSGLQSLLEKE